jgi:hypothetical protein
VNKIFIFVVLNVKIILVNFKISDSIYGSSPEKTKLNVSKRQERNRLAPLFRYLATADDSNSDSDYESSNSNSGNTVTSEEEGTQIVSNILRKTTTERTINRRSQMKEKRVQLRQVKKMRHQHHQIRTDTMKVTIHTSLIAAVTVNSICFTRMRYFCRVNLMTKNTLKLIPTTAKHC